MCAFGNCADLHRPGRRRTALSGGELRFGARGNYPLAQSVLSGHAEAQDLKLSALLGGALAAAVVAAVNQAPRHSGKPCFDLAARPLLAQYDCTTRIQADDVERV